MNIVKPVHLVKDFFSVGKSRILFNNKKQGENTNYYFNISKAKKRLGYPVYPQMGEDFISYLSVVDLLFNCSEKSLNILLNKMSKS